MVGRKKIKFFSCYQWSFVTISSCIFWCTWWRQDPWLSCSVLSAVVNQRHWKLFCEKAWTVLNKTLPNGGLGGVWVCVGLLLITLQYLYLFFNFSGTRAASGSSVEIFFIAAAFERKPGIKKPCCTILFKEIIWFVAKPKWKMTQSQHHAELIRVI